MAKPVRVQGAVKVEGLRHSLRTLNKIASKQQKKAFSKEAKDLVKKHTVPLVVETTPRETSLLSTKIKAGFSPARGVIQVRIGTPKKTPYAASVYWGHKLRNGEKWEGSKWGWDAVIATRITIADEFLKMLSKYTKELTQELNSFGLKRGVHG